QVFLRSQQGGHFLAPHVVGGEDVLAFLGAFGGAAAIGERANPVIHLDVLEQQPDCLLPLLFREKTELLLPSGLAPLMVGRRRGSVGPKQLTERPGHFFVYGTPLHFELLAGLPFLLVGPPVIEIAETSGNGLAAL